MAAGSHATLHPYPAVCSGCGGRIVVTSKTDTRHLWFEAVAPGFELTSYHFECKRKERQ